ncbi:VWA domain-containing protein, partial [Longimicrobium sp.]|uniref:VWA domain-containing protein n=1 Tax=Longimicrobium sp. TaxID=2029185 RepID=UPI002E324E21
MSDDMERLRRWRLLLGGEAADGTGVSLAGADLRMDGALAALYDGTRQGGLGSSAPNVARWLGDIREYFPSSVVRVMQQDAFERLRLRQMLLEPELLEAMESDVHLVATLLSFQSVMPEKTRETARDVVRKVVREVERRLAEPLRQAVTGSLSRSVRNRRPRHAEIDWNRTIRANLRHYQAQYRTIIPETRIGWGRRRSSLRDVILLIDQSGSMATSAVYSGIFGSVLASLPALSTRVIAFDTAVADLSDNLHDPVDVLFGIQLGGGTDINHALGYAAQWVRRPAETVLFLVSDLYEGGNRAEMLRRAAQLVADGVQLVALLALSDDGAPAYDHDVAATLAGFGVPAFACTPDQFPDLIAATLQKRDVGAWAAERGIATQRSA